jgi:hypothetical protein
MCPQFEICRSTTIDFVVNRSFFFLKKLQNKIIKLGGVFMVSSSQTLDRFLKQLEESGCIKYLPQKKGYKVLI